MTTMKSLDSVGLLRKVEYMLPATYDRDMVMGLARSFAKGMPYLTNIYKKSIINTNCNQVVIKVYRDELSMFMACIRDGGDLAFFSNNLPDTVN